MPRGTGVFIPGLTVPRTTQAASKESHTDTASIKGGHMPSPALSRQSSCDSPSSSISSLLSAGFSTGSPFASCYTADSGYPSPCHSNSGAGSPFTPAAMTPALSTCGSDCVSPPQLEQQLAALLLLQQQEDEVDAAINNLLNLRQQLAVFKEPTVPQAQPMAFGMAASLPVSFATCAFAPGTTAFDMNRASSGPTDLSVFDAAIAEAQLQQHQQWAVEQQLEANLQAEMLQLLTLV